MDHLVALIAFLDAHPVFYPFFVVPIITGLVNAFNAWLAAKWPTFAEALKRGGFDPLGLVLTLLKSKTTPRAPQGPYRTNAPVAPGSEPMSPGGGAAARLRLFSLRFAAPMMVASFWVVFLISCTPTQAKVAKVAIEMADVSCVAVVKAEAPGFEGLCALAEAQIDELIDLETKNMSAKMTASPPSDLLRAALLVRESRQKGGAK